MTNKEIIEKTLIEISKDSDWETRYAKYAKDILKHEAYHKELINKVRIKFPLSKYTSITKFRGKKVETDIRYLGQSIGSLFFEPDRNPYFKKSKSGYNDLVKRYPDIPKLQDEEEWNGRNMNRFRSFLSHIDVADAEIHSPEHKCENLLLREFHQTDSKKKSLLHIQPITFGGEFVQLTTNLSASKKGVVSFSRKGGGIDIMARSRHKDNSVYLGVFELKDQNKSDEPMSVVIQQALSYAVFIAKLLDSKGGSDWMKIFGFKKIPHTIDVVGLIPKGEETIIEEEFQIGSFTLQTRTLYFDKDALFKRERFEFSGSFKDLLMNSKSDILTAVGV